MSAAQNSDGFSAIRGPGRSRESCDPNGLKAPDSLDLMRAKDDGMIPITVERGLCSDPSRCEYRWRHVSGPWSCEYNHPIEGSGRGW